MTTTTKSEKAREVLTEIVGDLNCLRESARECTGIDIGYLLMTFDSTSDGSSNITNGQHRPVSGAIATLLKEGYFKDVADHIQLCKAEGYTPSGSSEIALLAAKEIEDVFEENGVEDEYFLLLFQMYTERSNFDYCSNISKPQRLESIAAEAATKLYTL